MVAMPTLLNNENIIIKINTTNPKIDASYENQLGKPIIYLVKLRYSPT